MSMPRALRLIGGAPATDPRGIDMARLIGRERRRRGAAGIARLRAIELDRPVAERQRREDGIDRALRHALGERLLAQRLQIGLEPRLVLRRHRHGGAQRQGRCHYAGRQRASQSLPPHAGGGATASR
jgi:hypothetical protein